MKSPSNTKHYFKKTVNQIIINDFIQIKRRRSPNDNIIFISPSLEEKLKKYNNINNYKINAPHSQVQCKYNFFK